GGVDPHQRRAAGGDVGDQPAAAGVVPGRQRRAPLQAHAAAQQLHLQGVGPGLGGGGLGGPFRDRLVGGVQRARAVRLGLGSGGGGLGGADVGVELRQRARIEGAGERGGLRPAVGGDQRLGGDPQPRLGGRIHPDQRRRGHRGRRHGGQAQRRDPPGS